MVVQASPHVSPPPHPPPCQALSVLALHCGVGDDIPRKATLDLLYHLLGVMPAYRCVQGVGVWGVWGGCMQGGVIPA